MAFLDDIFGISGEDIGTGLDFAEALTAAARGFQGRSAESEIPSLGRYNELIAAAGDPTSKRFVNTAALFNEQRKGDMLSAINAIMRANRRAKARGAIGVGINPERRDEALSSAILRGFERSGNLSRLDARNALMQQAEGYRQTFPLQERYGQANYTSRLTGEETMFDAIRKMFEQNQPSQSAAPEDWRGAYNPMNEGYL